MYIQQLDLFHVLFKRDPIHNENKSNCEDQKFRRHYSECTFFFQGFELDFINY